MRREAIALAVLLTAGALVGTVSPSVEASKDTRTASAVLYLPEVVVSSSLLLCSDVDDASTCKTLVPKIEQGAMRTLAVVPEYVAGDGPAFDATVGTPLPATGGRACRQKTGAVARMVLPESAQERALVRAAQRAPGGGRCRPEPV